MLKRIIGITLLVSLMTLLGACDFLQTTESTKATTASTTVVETTDTQEVTTSNEVTSTEEVTQETTVYTTQETTTSEVVTTTVQTTVETTTQISEYSVSFNTGTGSSIDTLVLDAGNTVIEPNDPTLEGHTFVGWYSDETLLLVFSFDIVITEDTTLYAKWSVNQYKIEYRNYDETVLYEGTFNYGTDVTGITVPDDITREGYTFTGWQAINYTTMPAHDIVLYPQFLSSITIYPDHNFPISFMDFRVLTHDNYVVLGDYSDNDKIGVFHIHSLEDGEFLRSLEYSGDEEYTHYGREIYFSGDYIIVPTAKSGYNTTVSSVFIYKFSDPSYERIISFDHGLSGYSVKLSGDTLYALVDVDDNSDGIYIYSLSDDTYERLVVPMTSDGVIRSFMVNGDYLIASDIAGGPDQTGIVYVFKVSDPDYIRVIIPTVCETGYSFGHSMKVFDNDLLVVRTDFIGYSTGNVYIYSLTDETYERHLTDSTIEDNDFYGFNAWVSGDYVLVNAEKADDTTLLYIYKLSDPGYERIITPFINNTAWVGVNPTVSGDYIIISKPFMREAGDEVIIYKFSDEDYERRISHDPNDENTNRRFSYYFVNGDYIYVSAPYYDNDTGAIYIYKISDETYSSILQADTPVLGDMFSDEMKVLGNIIYIEVENNDRRIIIYRISD